LEIKKLWRSSKRNQGDKSKTENRKQETGNNEIFIRLAATTKDKMTRKNIYIGKVKK
jgi:hypothetical protein